MTTRELTAGLGLKFKPDFIEKDYIYPLIQKKKKNNTLMLLVNLIPNASILYTFKLSKPLYFC